MSVHAICPDCDKNYRVPNERKVWHCKVCDGVLVLDPVGYEEALDAPPDEEEENQEPEQNPFDGHNHDQEKLHEELEIAKEMRDELGAIKVMRGLLIFNLILGLGLTALAYQLRGDDAAAPWRDVILAGSLSALILVLSIIVQRVPLPCSILMLALTVAGGAVYAIEGQDQIAIIAALFAIAYGWVTLGSWRLWKLTREYPDIYKYVLTHHGGRRRPVYHAPV